MYICVYTYIYICVYICPHDMQMAQSPIVAAATTHTKPKSRAISEMPVLVSKQMLNAD